jgi:LysR family glycine cleavage system transcriptional activator
MAPPIPLSSLRAFAEVGRLGSIKLAAVFLGVTPGAVSQQLKALEMRLGASLLERRHREVRLTVDGRRLFDPLSQAFRQLDEAVQPFMDSKPRRETLIVTTTPSFAASWLVPRLGAFCARHPDVEVRVDSSVRAADLRNEAIDVALRHGLGDYPGLTAVRLFTPRLIAIASPALLETGPRIHAPIDCLGYPLLQDRDRSAWTQWLAALGEVAAPRGPAGKGASFENDLLLIRAAAAGQGLALVRDIYALEELRAGRVVAVFKESWPTSLGYFFVTRLESTRTAKIAAFRNWLIEELASPPPK